MAQGADPDRAEARFHLFDTAIGPCGLAWSSAGLVQVQLPEASEAATESRLGRNAAASWSDALPPDISDCEARMRAYFGGVETDFSDITLDLSRANEFTKRVYAELRKVGWGQNTSYGALAKKLGEPGAARAVGAAMGKNPWPLIVPCHRVLAASGKIGGFSAYGGRATKRHMLQLERADADGAAPMLPGLFD
ncbi:methylated-DNA--[protein]-cysteine S-methyltransferase [Hyphomonas sp.]|uniref:methylated-DNA--[protein]-cysteine S-methyltransferase n=1 Tax=Hyphomonas sp. TaxID=87 RepID=UPI0032EE5C76